MQRNKLLAEVERGVAHLGNEGICSGCGLSSSLLSGVAHLGNKGICSAKAMCPNGPSGVAHLGNEGICSGRPAQAAKVFLTLKMKVYADSTPGDNH